MPDHSALLDEVEAMCREAGGIALRCRESLQTELKPDGSIVTNADREVEEFLRREIGRAMPGAAVWGEEMGYEAPNEKGLWVIDPVDGTSNFTYGQPLWGTTVGYFQDGALQLGCINCPELGWSLAGRKGGGATLNGEAMDPVRPGKIERFDLVGYGSIQMAAERRYPGKVRHVGAFVVEAGMFVTGGLRALLTNGVRLYDAAAGIVIARELGAEIREMDGSEWDETEWTRPERCRTFGFFPPDSGWKFD